MKKILITALFALAALGLFTTTAQAENRVVGQYSFGANDFPDTWGVGVEYDFVDVADASNLFVGASVEDSAGGGDFSGAVYSGTVGVQWELGDNYLIKTAYTYNWADGDVENTQSGSLSGIYQGDLWRFQVGLTKPSGVDLFYGTSAERKVYKDFAVGVGSRFNGNQYVLTSLYGSWTF